MGHSILTLQEERFDTRVALGGCMLNINGDTRDCLISRDSLNFANPTYTVVDKETRKELCTFRPYHLEGGPFFYQVQGVSQSRGDGTLIVPEHGMLSDPDAEIYDDEDH